MATAKKDNSALWERLREPFPADDVMFRPLRQSGGNYEVAAYLSSRAIMDRLDEVVGPENWSYDFHPLTITEITVGKNGPKELHVTNAKGILTVNGVAKASLGEASNMSPSKGCDSDAFKRAAVLHGIGRYLYTLPKMMIKGKYVTYGRIDDGAVTYLRSTLPQPLAREPQAPIEVPDEVVTNTTELPDEAEAEETEPTPVETVETPEPTAAPTAAPVADGIDPQDQADAIAELAQAVKQMKLPTGKDWGEWQRYAISCYMGIPAEQCRVKLLSPSQLRTVAKKVLDGTIYWPIEEAA
jgi:hypothetical protein